MKKLIQFGIWLFLFILSTSIFAQRGIPTEDVKRIKTVSKYAQHLDFIPEMVKLLKVPDGWEVSVAAAGLGRVRMLYPGPNGELYATRRDAGDVIMLKDPNGDHVFEDLVTVADNFFGVHGITMREGWLYLCNTTTLRRYQLNKDGTLGKMEVLINDLPSGGQHPNRTIDFGPDGMLYITVGTLCNDCKESDKEVASILQVDPTTWSRSIFASGLRNTIGFDWHPQTQELWGADNGADHKGNKWPPEEINHIIQNKMYGFPWAYGKREIDKTRDDPPGNTKKEVVAMSEPSVLELTPHMAPLAFQFFGDAANIPEAYSGDALVCWHGSWNRSKPVGFKVQRIVFRDGQAVGAEDFLTGFLKPTGLFTKIKARFGRPTGLTITPQGVIYVSDDANGVIYAIKRTTNI